MREEYLLNRLDWEKIQALTVDIVSDGNLRLAVSHLNASGVATSTEQSGTDSESKNENRF